MYSVITLINMEQEQTKEQMKYATTYIKDRHWYNQHIKNHVGSLMFPSKYYEVSRHVDIRKTKKALGMKGAAKLKVFVLTNMCEDFDERANPQIIYKYKICVLPSHPLGKDEDGSFVATCPQGAAYVIMY